MGDVDMLNKSYSYLVPLLSEHCKIDSDFVILINNTFVYHYDYPDEETFTLCYEYSDTESFHQYLELIKENELFKEIIESDEGKVFITVYFPLEFIKEYRLYKSGKFSRFSEIAKTIILNYILDIHNINNANKIRRVLYRDENLRKELEYKLDLIIDESLELSSKPHKVDEMFIFIKDESWR